LDYRTELGRRIGQFRRYLEPMDRRAHEVAQGTCALVFENRRPDGDFGKQAREERQPALAAVVAAFGEVGAAGGPERGGSSLPVLPEEGWREDGGRLRFVQFAFQKDCFYLDLPRQTLSFDEAMEVLWHRAGFFYLRDRPQSAMSGEIEGFDPFRRVYLYGYEGKAAEDTAFPFFRVWGLPLDSPLYITSRSLEGKQEWERDTLVT
jgi:hypothetical protein